jgi:hypothetical protein
LHGLLTYVRTSQHSALPGAIGGANASKTGFFDSAFPEITLFLAKVGRCPFQLVKNPVFFDGVV